MTRKRAGVKVRGNEERATEKDSVARAMVQGAVARAMVLDSFAVASADGAVAWAEVAGSRAEAMAKGAEARAYVLGSVASATRDGARAVSLARGAHAYACSSGTISRAERAGAVAIAETIGARAVAAARGSVAFGASYHVELSAEADGAILLCIGRRPVGEMPADVPLIFDLHSKVHKACSKPGTLDMREWHSRCGTTHCRAGWAVTVAGDAGKDLERVYGTPAAAAMIYAKAYPDQPTPDFYQYDNAKAITDIYRCALRESRNKERKRNGKAD